MMLNIWVESHPLVGFGGVSGGRLLSTNGPVDSLSGIP